VGELLASSDAHNLRGEPQDLTFSKASIARKLPRNLGASLTAQKFKSTSEGGHARWKKIQRWSKNWSQQLRRCLDSIEMFSWALSSATLSLFLTVIVHSQCVAANNSTGTFQNPSSRERARFRYWLPDAGVDQDIVVANIQNAGNIGAGGVEFLPFYDYGNVFDLYPSYVNLTTTNFGTPAFHELFLAALQAHKDAGLFMDVALGPNQGQGVPAENDDEGIQWDLVSSNYLPPKFTNLADS
jgi:hypothetical protein